MDKSKFDLVDSVARTIYMDLDAELKKLATWIVNDKIPLNRKNELIGEWTKAITAMKKQQQITTHKIKRGATHDSVTIKRALELIQYQISQAQGMLKHIRRLNAALKKEASA